jgi:class 3 adenylate cyclase
VGSTILATQLDPEELREVVQAYQHVCGEVIQRFEGYIAQYLGDGLLVYFGYPQAHEDDGQRAVRAALGMVEAMARLNHSLAQERGVQLAVRLGIHTGLVVGGGDGRRRAARTVGARGYTEYGSAAASLGCPRYHRDQWRHLSADRRIFQLP